MSSCSANCGLMGGTVSGLSPGVARPRVCDAERVRLQTRPGAYVELRAIKAADQPLLVEGAVDALDGRAWRFRAPVLTLEEAKRLADWLLKAAKGRIELQERLSFADLSFTLDEHEYGQ